MDRSDVGPPALGERYGWRFAGLGHVGEDVVNELFGAGDGFARGNAASQDRLGDSATKPSSEYSYETSRRFT